MLSRTFPAFSLLIHEAKFTNRSCPSLVPLRSVSSMCAASPDALHHTGSCACAGRCDPKCHPRDSVLPGGPGMWCQRQVPGGHHLNNASCPALALACAPLWSAPETSVAWVFNHLACTSLLSHQSHATPSQPTSFSSLFPARKLMRSLLSLCLSLCVCVRTWACVYEHIYTLTHTATALQNSINRLNKIQNSSLFSGCFWNIQQGKNYQSVLFHNICQDLLVKD